MRRAALGVPAAAMALSRVLALLSCHLARGVAAPPASCDRESVRPFIFVQPPHTGTSALVQRLEIDSSFKRCAPANCLLPYPNKSMGESLVGYVQPLGRDIRRCPDPWVDSRQVPDRTDRTYFNRHIMSMRYKEGLPPEMWQSAFKFAFVRTPWQRVLSAAAWKKVIPAGAAPRYYTVQRFRAWIVRARRLRTSKTSQACRLSSPVCVRTALGQLYRHVSIPVLSM